MISRFTPKNGTGVPKFSLEMGKLKEDFTKMSYDKNTQNGRLKNRKIHTQNLGDILKKDQNRWCGNSQNR